MSASNVTTATCIHCLRSTDKPEGDHVFPGSWYPDTTPPRVQRWTAPSCARCNRKHGQLEKDLLVRMVLCLDPKSPAASGLDKKVFRSLGIDVIGLPDGERACREQLRAKVRSEFMSDTSKLPAASRIPGLGPAADEPRVPQF